MEQLKQIANASGQLTGKLVTTAGELITQNNVVERANTAYEENTGSNLERDASVAKYAVAAAAGAAVVGLAPTVALVGGAGVATVTAMQNAGVAEAAATYYEEATGRDATTDGGVLSNVLSTTWAGACEMGNAFSNGFAMERGDKN